MHRQKRELTDSCRLCGENIDAMDPRNYALSVAALLATSAPAGRGASKYDAEREDWSTTPRPPVVAALVHEDA